MTRTQHEGLPRAILIASLMAYPLLGTLVSVTLLPSLVASVPVRAFVAVASIQLIWLTRRAPPSPTVLALLVFWCAYLVRLLWDWAVADVPAAGEALAFFVLTCLLPAVALMRVPAAWWNESRLANGLFITGAATCIAAVAIGLTGLAEGRSLLDETARLSFDTVNPITYGHVAVSTLIVALRWRLISRRHGRLVLAIGLIAALVVLQLAASRGPLVALAVCLVALGIVQRRFRWFFIVVAPLLTLLFFNADSILEQRFSDIEDDPSTLERLLVQSNAIAQFLDNPWLGSAFIELELQIYPHNPFIEAAMATGVIGLLLFTWVFLAACARVVRMLREGKVVLPLLALQYFVAAQFSGSLFSSNTMWMFIGILFAITRRRRRQSSGQEHRPVVPRRPVSPLPAG